MEDRRTIQVPVPDGFPPMSLPVDPQNRYRDEEIILEPAKEEDLIAIADGLYRCFPDVWWCETEALSRRPPEDIRVGRFAERLRPLVTHDPRFVFVVAKVASTGEFAGVAGWHSPDDQWNGNMWLCDVPGGLKQGSLGWTSGLKRMPNEIQEIWDAVDVDAWLAMWNAYERVRKEEMGSEPHWYLAPLIVHEKFRGRGIGRRLLQYAIDRADAQDPPVPIYLEALPNARPVYLHVGFEPREGKGREIVLIRRGPGRS